MDSILLQEETGLRKGSACTDNMITKSKLLKKGFVYYIFDNFTDLGKMSSSGMHMH